MKIGKRLLQELLRKGLRFLQIARIGQLNSCRNKRLRIGLANPLSLAGNDSSPI